MANGKIAIDQIKIGKRHRRDIGDTSKLMVSMSRVGLLHPVVLDKNHNLVSGFRRLETAKLLEWDAIPFVVADSVTDAITHLVAERDENICRKDFTPSEAVALGKVLEEMERPKAAERKSQAKGKPQGEKVSYGNFPEETEAPTTRDVVGEAVGMSGRTYSKAKTVIEAAEKDPEIFGECAEEMERTGKVNGPYEKVQEIKRNGGKTSPDAPPANGTHSEPKAKGVGVIRANEAIDCLMRIPKDDALRKRGFQIVTDWIRTNKGT